MTSARRLAQFHEIDEPLHTMQQEIEKLQTGGRIADSPLYRNLSKSMQTDVDEKGLDYITKIYQFDTYNKTFIDDVNFAVPTNKNWSWELNVAQIKTDELISLFEDKNSKSIRKLTMSEGELPSLTIAMYLTVKRYRKRFGLSNFLPCFIFSQNHKTVNLESLKKNLVFSRWHFLLTGSYLPVVAFYAGDGHATNTLFIPSNSSHGVAHSEPTWHIIHINPNGSNEDYPNRFHSDPDEVIRSYQEYVGARVHTRRSDCSSNIQKNYSTCTVWCLLLTMMILRQYRTFRERSKPVIDFLNLYCFGLSRKTENAKVIDQFNDYIGDLVISFRYMVFDIMLTLHKTGNLSLNNYIYEILRGLVHETIELDVRIFEAVEQAMKHFEKYVGRQSSKKLVLSYLNSENDKLSNRIYQLKKQGVKGARPGPIADQNKNTGQIQQPQQPQHSSKELDKLTERYTHGRYVYGLVLSDEDDHKYDGRPEEESDEETEAAKELREIANISQGKWGVPSRYIRRRLSEEYDFPDTTRKRKSDNPK